MPSPRSAWRIALALVTVAAACRSRRAAPEPSELPAELAPRKAVGQAGKRTVPAVFAEVPADTPYVVAALEPLPLAGAAALGPVIQRALALWLGASHPVLDAVATELAGKWNPAGLASLGLAAAPHFVVYGLGPAPLVARVEIADEAAVRAALERVAANAHGALVAGPSRAGRGYWRSELPDGLSAVVAVAEHQLIFAAGSGSDIDVDLDRILGNDHPAKGMADAAPVVPLIQRHGFAPSLVGFVETRRIASAVLVAAGAMRTPACAAAIDRLAFAVPRVAIGAGAGASIGLVLELGSGSTAAVKTLGVGLPGLGAMLGGEPMFALTAGFSIPKAMLVARAALVQFQRLGDACQLDEFAGRASALAAALPEPPPEPKVVRRTGSGDATPAAVPAPAPITAIDALAGGAISVRSAALAAGSWLPSRLDAIAFATATDARVLFARSLSQSQKLRRFWFSTDGKLHDLQFGDVALPFPVAAGVGDQMVVLAAGDGRTALGETLLAAAPGKAPLVALTAASDAVIGLALDADRDLDPDQRGLLDALRGAFGRVAATLEVSDAGLALWTSLALK